MANSKVEALEAEASGLRRDLISAMDANNASKEQLKSSIREVGFRETAGEAERRASRLS